MRYPVQIIFTILLVVTTAHAQSLEQSWSNLQTLRSGEKIQVVDQKLKSIKGTFVSSSEEAIIFRVGQDEVSVMRADVFRVSSRERGRTRGRNAWIGFAVGAGVGLGIGGAMFASGALDVSTGEAATAAFVSAPLTFGLIGAGVGAVMPPGRPAIYRAERRKALTP